MKNKINLRIFIFGKYDFIFIKNQMIASVIFSLSFQIIPLLVLKACVLLAIPTFCFHRFFFTKIEVQ